MSDTHRPLLQPWTVPQKPLMLRWRLESSGWTLNHWFAIETCCKKHLGWHIWLSSCSTSCRRLKRVQLAWQSNGSLEMVRNSGVPGSLYTKPRNRENAMSAQRIATGNPETVNHRQNSVCSLFIGMIASFYFFPSLFRVREWRCKVCCVNLGHGNTPRKALIM